MDFEFARDEYNGLLKRRELEFLLTFEGATPSRRQILGKLCALQNVPEDRVVLDSIKTSFGKQELNGYARIYEDVETLKATEPGYLVERSSAPETGEGAEEA
ncbi:30S ribosomal protein S24e [Methanogenium organophilum]|uniref:Small ribosomal subunit protein eS24 n=1 Tax=Methanogenium organophilum TaxID=2199 RepID=A0A9X9S2F8_METOG|nr:30S ribosomal protein S24e [Methanogenium organophilum]WAI00321.1 30S ribosomal protein S24e [Methanogenium organophilum]